MFEVGFSEILIIFVLALVVLGPEKLPRVASQIGRWIGRARGMARQFREQLEEEVNLEEARKVPPPQPSPDAASMPPVSAEAEQQVAYPDTYSHAHPTDSEGRPIEAPLPAPMADTSHPRADTSHPSSDGPDPSPDAPHASPEGPHASPDTSHASLDAPPKETRAPEAPPPESAGPDLRQHDWVGGLSGSDKPAQGARDAAYASSDERGT